MKIYNWFTRTLFAITHPNCWIRVGYYNKKWDCILRQLIENNKFVSAGEYTAKLGNAVIWIANYPYSAFGPYSSGLSSYHPIPSRLTTYQARNKLINDLVNDNFKKYMENI